MEEKEILDSFVSNKKESSEAWGRFCDSEKGKSDEEFDRDVWDIYGRSGDGNVGIALAIENALPDCHD